MKYWIVLVIPFLSFSTEAQLMELQRLAQYQSSGGQVETNIFSDAIIDLNSNTMYNNGTVLATTGQTVSVWADAKGNYDFIQNNIEQMPLVELEDGVKALRFDGVNDFLKISDSTGLNYSFNESWTWTIYTGNDVDNSGAIIHKGNSSSRQYGFFYYNGNFITFFYGSQNISEGLLSGSQVLTITYDGNTNQANIYRNDVLIDSFTSSGTLLSPLGVIIGARHNNNDGTSFTFYYDGTLRRIVNHDRVLTRSEITELYNFR